MNCDRQGCTFPARWRPVLRYYAPAPHIGTFTAEVGLNICADCRKKMKVADVRSTEIDQAACKTCSMTGKMQPDLTSTRLEWIPIAESGLGPRKP